MHGLLYRHWYGTLGEKKLVVCVKRRLVPWTPVKMNVYLYRGPGYLWEKKDGVAMSRDEFVEWLT